MHAPLGSIFKPHRISSSQKICMQSACWDATFAAGSVIGNDRVKGQSGPGDLFIEPVMDNTKLTIMAGSIPQCVALGLHVRSWVLLCGAGNGTWGMVVHAPNPSTLNRGQGGQRNLSSRSA